MGQLTDTFDLAPLKLVSGEGRHLEGLVVKLDPLDFGGQEYAVVPPRCRCCVDVSRMTGGGYALRLRFEAGVHGPCMRCLQPAEPMTTVDAREIDVPGETSEELTSPYMTGEELDVRGWTRDAFHLALPGPSCAGRTAAGCARSAGST